MSPWFSRAFVALSLLAVGVRLAVVGAGWPVTFCDELLTTEPAVEWVTHGQFGNPGFIPFLDVPGYPGRLGQWSVYYWPVYGWLHAGFAWMFGTGLWVRRLVDACVLGGVMFVFWRTARCRLGQVSSGFATASFVLSLQVWWSNPGRADLLGCGFGLAALGVLWRGMSGEGVGWRRAVGVGVLLGLTGLTHPTAGFFWGMVVAAQLLAAAGWRGSLRAVPAVGVGGVLGLAVWLPAILVDPAYWLASMRLLFGVKEALDRDFVRAAVNLGSWLFVWYPLPWILALAGGVVSCRAAGAWRSWPAALGLVFVVGWLNQCRTIEYYNTNAIPHFWAALCLLGGAGASALGRALSREGDRPRLRLAAVGGVWSLLLVGAFLPQVRSLGAVLATRPWVAHAAVGSALQRSIRPRDRVICATALFFDVPSTNRVSLWWYDRHDLRQANWVALTRPAEQMAPSGGRLADALTPGQMSVLRDEFCVVAEMPPSTNEAGVLARKHPLPGLYLYERRNRAEAVK